MYRPRTPLCISSSKPGDKRNEDDDNGDDETLPFFFNTVLIMVGRAFALRNA